MIKKAGLALALLLGLSAPSFADPLGSAPIQYGSAPAGSGGGSGTVTSISNSDSTLTLSPNPITGAGTVSLNLAHANTWSATQTLSGLTLSGITGSTQCLQANTSGVVSGTGSTCGSSGTVTSVASGAGLTGGPITTTGTLSLTELIRAVTGTTDTILSTDAALLVTYSNASAITVTLPQATGSFAAGFAFSVQNKGAGTVTITPATSTINGTTTLPLAQNQGCDIVSDGTNWQVSACTAVGGSASGVSSITGTANQITASASTGAVTLSLPTAVQTTSLALNGATIGANALAATGSINASTTVTAGTNLVAGATGTIGFTGRAVVSSPAAGDFQIGGTNGTTPVTYTLGFQNGAGTNIAGQNTTIVASVGSGNAAQGNLILQVGQPTTSGAGYGTALTGVNIVGGTAQVRLPNIAADTALTDTSVCADTTNKGLFTGTGTAGICLGNVSSRRFKTKINYIPDGLTTIMELKPADWFYKPGFGDNGARQQVGFIAEDFAAALPKLTRYDAQGKPNGTDILGTVPYLVRAIQQQQQEINELWAALAAMFLFACGGFVWMGRGR